MTARKGVGPHFVLRPLLEDIGRGVDVREVDTAVVRRAIAWMKPR